MITNVLQHLLVLLEHESSASRMAQPLDAVLTSAALLIGKQSNVPMIQLAAIVVLQFGDIVEIMDGLLFRDVVGVVASPGLQTRADEKRRGAIRIVPAQLSARLQLLDEPVLLLVEHAIGVRAIRIQPELLVRGVLQELTEPGADSRIILKPDVDSLAADGLRDAEPDAANLKPGTPINGLQMSPVDAMDVDADRRGDVRQEIGTEPVKTVTLRLGDIMIVVAERPDACPVGFVQVQDPVNRFPWPEAIGENAELKLLAQQEVDYLYEVRMKRRLSADEGNDPFMARVARVGESDKSSKVAEGENVVVQSAKRSSCS